MKLAAWRKRAAMTQAALAELLGCSQSYISQIERATDPMVPSKDALARIYEVTGGAVEPNDFYDLPALSPQKNAA